MYTFKPFKAEASAMPDPIIPAPRMPTLRNSRASDVFLERLTAWRSKKSWIRFFVTGSPSNFVNARLSSRRAASTSTMAPSTMHARAALAAGYRPWVRPKSRAGSRVWKAADSADPGLPPGIENPLASHGWLDCSCSAIHAKAADLNADALSLPG